jgi:hypothetical protein
MTTGFCLLGFQVDTHQPPSDPATVFDEDVEVLRFVDVDHPRSPIVAVGTGVVVVQALLDDEGRVISASALAGDPVLTPVSLSNISRWVFKPNRQRRVVVVYEFSHTGMGGCTSDRSLFVLRPPNFASFTLCLPAPSVHPVR